ncbi:hypothetical protein BT96DRAFT_1006361 [Gymnopus androsaceus JB14]|uniref:Uncharacterized protein n=1 Tax=Gymnopus androsaceus JB14 TaxID=1447944 RepID=A0A6A4GLF4_9AGAR|nr:hypothetical protein BT96DRAFT_1006361 [Gymnopus androsaceus JB14]
MSMEASSSTSDASQELKKLLEIIGPEVLKEYRQTVFPPEILQMYPEFCPLDKPLDWVKLDNIKLWYFQHLLTRQSTQLASSTQSPAPLLTPTSKIAFKSSKRAHSTLPAQLSVKQEEQETKSIVTKSSKRKRPGTDTATAIEVEDSSDDESHPCKTQRSSTRKGKMKGDRIMITCQASCDSIEYYLEPLSCWPVLHEGIIAHIIDMNEVPESKWPMEKGKPISMHSLVMKADQDSWGNGTYGSTKPGSATSVQLLDNVKCQVAHLKCQGSYICDQFDVSVLHPHFDDVDMDSKQALWEAECQQNKAESSSVLTILAAFYRDIMSTTCDHLKADGDVCGGLAVLCPLKECNFDGQTFFIGCANFAGSKDTKHQFTTILRNINCDLLKKLFQNKGQFPEAVLTKYQHNMPSNVCYNMVSPRNHWGKGLCCVFSRKEHDDKHLKPGARYIQKILSTSSDTGNIIVLMLPGLAELLHEAQTTLHDNTYKGVSGD